MVTTASYSNLRLGMLVAAASLGPLCMLATAGAMFLSLPVIEADLAASQSDVHWIANSYPLVFAALLLPAGAIADRYGRRRVIIIGLGVLTVAQFAGAATDSPEALIATRVIGGIGAAVAFPGTLATITAAVPEVKRRLSVAVWSASIPLGGAIGAFLAGVVLEFGEWQAVLVALGIMTAATMVLSIVAIPETRDPERTAIDPVGAVLSVAAVAAVVIGVVEGPERGWLSVPVVTALALGVGLTWGFVRWELRREQPMLDVRLFANAAFGAGSFALLLAFVVGFGWTYLASLYMGHALGFSPLEAGIGYAPFGAAMVLGVPASMWLMKRLAPKHVLYLAFAIGAVGCALLALFASTENYWAMVPGFFLVGAPIGLGAPAGTEAITNALPRSRQGIASAVNDLSRELGAALGIAVLGSAYAEGLTRSDDPASSVAHGIEIAMTVGAALLIVGLAFIGWRYKMGARNEACTRLSG